MSVQTNQYAGFGFWLDYDQAKSALAAKYSEDELDDFFDKYHISAYDTKIVEVNGFSLISDNMGSQFFFFGKIAAKSEVHESLHFIIPKVPSAKVRKALQEEIINVFGTDFGIKPTLLVFTHYR